MRCHLADRPRPRGGGGVGGRGWGGREGGGKLRGSRAYDEAHLTPASG